MLLETAYPHFRNRLGMCRLKSWGSLIVNIQNWISALPQFSAWSGLRSVEIWNHCWSGVGSGSENNIRSGSAWANKLDSDGTKCRSGSELWQCGRPMKVRNFVQSALRQSIRIYALLCESVEGRNIIAFAHLM
jgi:hypothetical protein